LDQAISAVPLLSVATGLLAALAVKQERQEVKPEEGEQTPVPGVRQQQL
jgi:hypothetical protein